MSECVSGFFIISFLIFSDESACLSGFVRVSNSTKSVKLSEINEHVEQLYWLLEVLWYSYYHPIWCGLCSFSFSGFMDI